MSERKSQQQLRWETERERGFATAEGNAPDAFVDWWLNHDHCSKRIKNRDGIIGYSSGISAHKAWQLECYRLEFRERRHENAAGTGVNYAYYGWHRPEDPPRTSSPHILEAHAKWCIEHGKPDPRISKPMPPEIQYASTFNDIKEVLSGVYDKKEPNDALKYLCDKMDMNKAIGWTEADSDAIENPMT